MTLTSLTTPLMVRGKVRVKVQDARVYFPTRATQRDSAPTTTSLPLHHTTTLPLPLFPKEHRMKSCSISSTDVSAANSFGDMQQARVVFSSAPPLGGFGVAVTVRVRLGLTSLMVAHSVIGLLVLLLVLLLGLLLGLGQHWRYLS